MAKIEKQTCPISTFEVETSLLNEVLKSENWDTPRNDYYGLSDSFSILLKYNLDNAEGFIHAVRPEHKTLYQKILQVISHVQKMYGASLCAKAIITNLPAGKNIKEHIDPGWPFSVLRRFHWCLTSNDQCYLKIGENICRLKAGDIWEIDNKLPHSAYNDGSTDRLHLIFDLLIVDEATALTPGPFPIDSFDSRLFRTILQRKKKTGEFIARRGKQQ